MCQKNHCVKAGQVESCTDDTKRKRVTKNSYLKLGKINKSSYKGYISMAFISLKTLIYIRL